MSRSGGLLGDATDAAGPRRERVKEALLGYGLLLPSLVIYGAFFFFALGQLFYLGLHQQNRQGSDDKWVGFSQFTEVLTGPDFQEGLINTLKYVVLTVPPGLVLGILLATAANRRLRGIKFFHTVFASTVATSTAVASVIFLVLVNPTVGYFKDVGFINLNNPSTALIGVSLSSIWQNLGLTFVIVLAGLQAVPDEVMEAARLDGYGPVRRLLRITLPMISPTLLFLIVVLTIFAFQAYAQIDILTNGGPAGSTETLVFKIVRNQDPVNLGRGSVMALGLFAITFLVSMAQLTILNRRVHYGD